MEDNPKYKENFRLKYGRRLADLYLNTNILKRLFLNVSAFFECVCCTAHAKRDSECLPQWCVDHGPVPSQCIQSPPRTPSTATSSFILVERVRCGELCAVIARFLCAT